ncbi:serine hydrolase domain-containing protein [Psychroserpens ponticola]|uniref:Serine hydrolase n=1 Tax=Psychroserpens ponticola TaxID=2932268 RepID=A0ABY7S170_9FLAO|nr:serine hydrolase [Psychroserpens ponticola]WCO03146.1 serine hydrolase [Psychroserpens ponticola]
MKTVTLLLSIFYFSCSFGQIASSKILDRTIPELEESRLEDSSLKFDSIINLLNRISDREHGGVFSEHGDLRGLVVIEKNKIVLEEGYNSFWRLSINDVRSAGKSITALLLGVAMQDGLVDHLDQDVYSFFSKDAYPSVNEGYKKVKLKHLLNMTSGLDADTDDFNTTGHAGHWIAKDDWKDYILSVSLTGTPGKQWVYADINAVLIGAIIEETSGMSLRDYAKEKLFDPLGIQQFHWYTNVSNQTGGAGNLFLSTLDFAKLGLIVSNQGKCGDTQIIAPDYIKRLSERTFDLTDAFGLETYYGMLWYKSTKVFDGDAIDYIYASGYGGNHLVVVPDKELVIAVSSGAYGERHSHRRSYAIWNKILESFK